LTQVRRKIFDVGILNRGRQITKNERGIEFASPGQQNEPKNIENSIKTNRTLDCRLEARYRPGPPPRAATSIFGRLTVGFPVRSFPPPLARPDDPDGVASVRALRVGSSSDRVRFTSRRWILLVHIDRPRRRRGLLRHVPNPRRIVTPDMGIHQVEDQQPAGKLEYIGGRGQTRRRGSAAKTGRGSPPRDFPHFRRAPAALGAALHSAGVLEPKWLRT